MATMPGWIMAGTNRHVTANFPDEPDEELFCFAVDWAWQWACKNFSSDPNRATWTWVGKPEGYGGGGCLRLDEGE